MSDMAPTIGRRTALMRMGAPVVIFGLFFLAVWLEIGPHLLYQYQTPVFLVTGDFFRGFLGRPGGPLEYVSLFLAQFCCVPWLGALIIVAVAWRICLLTRTFLRRMAGGEVRPWLSFLPAIFLLVLHGQYDYRLLPSMALLTALLFVNLYVRAAWSVPLRALLFAAMVLLLYWLAGGICILFGVLCGIFELAVNRKIALGVLFILLAPAAPFAVAMYSYEISASEAFVNLHPYRSVYMQLRPGPDAPPSALTRALSFLAKAHLSLMVFFPLAALAAAFRGKLSRAVAAVRRRLAKWRIAPRPAPPGAWTLIALGTFLLAGAAAFYLTHDPGVKKRLAVDYYAERCEWQKVLDTARAIPGEDYDIYTMHEVNRALYHTGRLPDDLCRFPQFVHTPSIQLTVAEMNNVGYTKFAEFSLELGAVNFVQHWAQTAYEINGSPRLLRLLVKANILSRRPEAAKTILRRLRQDLISREWADRYLAALDADPLMTDDPEMKRVRAVMLDRDYGYGGFGGFDYDRMLAQFIESNPRNREAVEYLMAFYLLTRQMDLMCANLGLLENLDLKRLPRTYEEAVALVNAAHPDRRIAPGGRSISPECLRRLDEFLNDLDLYQHGPLSSKKGAFETLTRKWGGSYFFFAAFGFTEPRPGWRMVKLPPVGAPKRAD